ncbi:MAG: transposase [Reichenbachiella sp.]
MGTHLSIDETALSQGELYTIVTNKAGKGMKGSLIALIKGTNSEYVNTILKQIGVDSRRKVVEVTLDMAASMGSVCKVGEEIIFYLSE